MRANSVYTYLANNGPSTHDDLPRSTTAGDEVSRFKLSGSPGDVASGIGSNQNQVYYLPGKHDPLTVVRAWRDANPGCIKHLPAWGIHQRICQNYPEFKEASAELFGPFEHMTANNDQKDNPGVTDMECPFCGAGDIDSFPRHRKDCPEL